MEAYILKRFLETGRTSATKTCGCISPPGCFRKWRGRRAKNVANRNTRSSRADFTFQSAFWINTTWLSMVTWYN